ncbi:RNA 2',3'-cyclic phosphodiesterase [Bacillus sp. CGMCC 1.16607]|uniref:RNA 2',3'-cyclic phosphodiesterase n=1 Tax=Bacillus sp. CGMCC 1.16607 TaxID=3351842 RepID=UPI0036344539
MSNKTHYFLAVRIPDSTKQVLYQAIENIKKDFPFQRWVHIEDYHITLAFLGFATNNQLTEINNLVKKQLENEKTFSLSISHLGTFGTASSPRIFWAGLENSPSLQQLREKVYTTCIQAGFQLEKRPFSPHITLARKWDSDEGFHSDQLEKQNPFHENLLSFHTAEVVLYKTNLLQTPKYENLITFSLQS